MSQTLSLPPDIYSLYIKPPVAGVDFTGTPTPTVSYQWKRNGAAIAGQDAATISGVGVVQSGSTVTLADGDTISIDIILTNPVSVVTKTVSAVIDAAIPAPVISPISIRLVSAPNDPVSTIPNASIGSQIMVASAGSVSVVTTPPLLPTYQWRRGFAAIAGATAQTYTLEAADADSIIDCVVTATNSGGTTTRTASATVGTLPAAGWTDLTPSADSRLIYVSNDGDDVAAASVKGRGYYLPSDPEIGADPTNPVGPIVAYRNPQRGLMKLPGGLRPDWVLFRRGQTFVPSELFDPSIVYQHDAATSFGLMFTRVWNASSNRFERGTESSVLQGRSSSERFVVTAWGNPSESRPKLSGGLYVVSHWSTSGATLRNTIIASIDAANSVIGWWHPVDPRVSARKENILIEDCIMREVRHTGGPLTIKRCVVSGNWLSTDHNQGMFVRAELGSDEIVTAEECIFDRNGYKENPFDATKWTAGVVAPQEGQQYAPGAGVQPLRSFYDRNVYVSTGDGVNHATVVLRGNIFSRGGGGGTVQMRQGGLCERNLYMWNENVGSYICGPGVLFKNNTVLHDDHMLPPGGWGLGPRVANSENWKDQGTGWSLDNDLAFVFDGNCIAHYHRGSNGGTAFNLANASTSHIDRLNAGEPVGTLLSGTVIVQNNCFNFEQVTPMSVYTWGTMDDVEIGNNAVASVSGDLVLSGAVHLTSVAAKGSVQYSIGDESVGGNRYFSSNATPFGANTFAQWKAIRAELDAESEFYSDFAAFKAAAGWTAPERDIVSYMQSVDPTYVVNEDVYVDEDATVKQSSRQKVWEVLVNHTAWPGAMTEAQAKLTARRYHAFVTFIQRAKENRKGAWDSRWTAEAVNNYIRAGFGKTAVTGAYDSRSMADRLADYTT